MAENVFVGLGCNLGDRRVNLDAAVSALNRRAGVRVVRVSSYVETQPVGGPPGQRPYLNAAAELDTTLSPDALLDAMQEIESDLGRVRAQRWGPRTIDLDLLLFGDRVIQSERLTVPHPRMHERRFVLAPLAEIAPQAVHPTSGKTIAELLAELPE